MVTPLWRVRGKKSEKVLCLTSTPLGELHNAFHMALLVTYYIVIRPFKIPLLASLLLRLAAILLVAPSTILFVLLCLCIFIIPCTIPTIEAFLSILSLLPSSSPANLL